MEQAELILAYLKKGKGRNTRMLYAYRNKHNKYNPPKNDVLVFGVCSVAVTALATIVRHVLAFHWPHWLLKMMFGCIQFIDRLPLCLFLCCRFVAFDPFLSS